MIKKIGLYRDPRNKGKPWAVRWFTVVDPETGKRKRFCKSFEFKRDAERFRAEKVMEFEQQGPPKATSKGKALKSFLDSWLRRREAELKPASFELYASTVTRLHDYFGKDSLLLDITPERAEDFILSQKNIAPGREGNKLSDWTREQVKRHCKKIFAAALEWGYMRTNPFGGLKSKKLTTKRWFRAKSSEYHALLEAVPGLREKVAYALFYTAGLRLHEAFALTWDWIDFENCVVVINNREGTEIVPEFNIKDHEKRRIPLPSHTIDLLTQWQTEAPEGVPFVLLTAERYERVKAKWLMIRKRGLPWRNRYLVNNVLRNFKSHVKRAGIKPVGKFTVHTLRKCAGQNWADHLPMNVVKELMGHSNISTTAEFYNQVDRDHEKKAAQVVQALLENHQGDKQSDVKVTYEADLRRIGANS